MIDCFFSFLFFVFCVLFIVNFLCTSADLANKRVHNDMRIPLQVASMNLSPERHPQRLNKLKLQVDNDLKKCLQHRMHTCTGRSNVRRSETYSDNSTKSMLNSEVQLFCQQQKKDTR